MASRLPQITPPLSDEPQFGPGQSGSRAPAVKHSAVYVFSELTPVKR